MGRQRHTITFVRYPNKNIIAETDPGRPKVVFVNLTFWEKAPLWMKREVEEKIDTIFSHEALHQAMFKVLPGKSILDNESYKLDRFAYGIGSGISGVDSSGFNENHLRLMIKLHGNWVELNTDER